ncbi:MAG: hypothetical protein IT438_10915 [Phycisphaerales bacterium]|nr:hypothetical protein [Phycisphaerales bacterium]
MPSDYASLCHDHYLNQRLGLKMDLHLRRDTVLSLFDRVSKARPSMGRFRRYANELALESTQTGGDPAYQWMSVRKTSVRSGSVNHHRDADAHDLHRLVLEAAPYFLDISPLDIDHLEVLFGFDLLAGGNHDAIVFSALMGGSRLATLCDHPSHLPIECQPVFGVTLIDDPVPGGGAAGASDIQAFFEVKTRTGGGHGLRGGAGGAGGGGPSRRARAKSDQEPSMEELHEHPISLYLILRTHGPVGNVRDLGKVYNRLVACGEELLERRIVPNLLLPVREAIASA